MSMNDHLHCPYWSWDVAFKPGDVQDIITKHTAGAEPVE